VIFATVIVILSVVCAVLLLEARDRVRGAEVDRLRAGERLFNRFDAEQQRDRFSAVTAFAAAPTLTTAIDEYLSSRATVQSGRGSRTATLYGAVATEVERIASITAADIVAVIDPTGQILASAGPSAERWPIGEALPAAAAAAVPDVVVLQDRVFRLSTAGLRVRNRDVGTLLVGSCLDDRYAQALSAVAGAGIVVSVGGRVVGSTVPDGIARSLLAVGSNVSGPRRLGEDEYAVQTLLASGPATVSMLASVDAAAQVATSNALSALLLIALWAFVLAAVGSLWLARTLTEPINHLAGAITTMTTARDFGRGLPKTGNSREVDALTDSFNDLMHGLTASEGERRRAYVETIRALAATLDARDPCTAGHSERVSDVAVVIARRLELSEADVSVIRLGALLHDIGKIGLADEVLQKPGSLSQSEFEEVKRHPTLGARILRQVSFLEPHLPIVELHHERPDGRGYPYGLQGDAIPLAARIVHVADAFDAITTARAYRPARPVAVALGELRRCAGTQFDERAVDALCAAQLAAPSLRDDTRETAAVGA
jgi:putative nucleotidyltransferase with HDIG domain